jgi:hypothetical protein
MLFLGQFSFLGHHHDDAKAGEPLSGHFTGVVEAADAEQADRLLRALVHEHRRKHDEFKGVTAVFLDALVAVKSVPKKGAVIYFAEYFQDLPDTLSAVLPHASDRNFSAYALEPDEPADDDESEAVPFLLFEHDHDEDADA